MPMQRHATGSLATAVASTGVWPQMRQGETTLPAISQAPYQQKPDIGFTALLDPAVRPANDRTRPS